MKKKTHNKNKFKFNKKIHKKTFFFKKNNKKYKTTKNNKKYIKKKINKQKNIKNKKNIYKKPNKQIKNKKIKIINKKKNYINLKNKNTISEISKKTSTKKNKIIKIIKSIDKNINTKKTLNIKISKKIIHSLGLKTKKNKLKLLEKSLISKNKPNKKKTPVVTIMGHVNHGKTSLINYIKSKNINNNEHGKITQHIKTYTIKKNKKNITFLDTPGHSSFINMRKKGIKLTDIIVLVISINDGIMPQTKEIIKYAKKNNVPIIIAINKIDKKEYINNIDNIKKDINKYGIIPEEWGGENIFVEISAKLGLGIKKLIKSIITLSEIMELKTNTKDPASGIVIESKINKKKGLITNILIKNGTLKIGDIILCGYKYGKIKTIYNDIGEKITSATTSTPVKILGLKGNIKPGEKFNIIKNIKKAKKISKYRKNKTINKQKKNKQTKNIKTIFEELNKNTSNNTINIIIKTDTHGSIEAILESIKNLPQAKSKINIIYSKIGEINKTDLIISKTSKSIIIGFNTKINNHTKKNILKNKIKIYQFKIIYDLIKKIKKIIESKIKKNNNKKIIGRAKVKNIFKLSKLNSIAGCIVLEGSIKKTNPIRIIRNNDIIYKGKIKSLRRYKKNVDSIKKGTECGIEIKNYSKINIGDIIETLKNE